MKFKFLRSVLLFLSITFFIFTLYTLSGTKSVYAQQPTGSIPTVTGSPTGPTAKVDPSRAEGNGINIRSGPNTTYDVIGIMYVDQEYPIIGKSEGGSWLLIKDVSLSSGQGWVYSANTFIYGGEIPVAEVPPTPLPKVTASIDPTLAAQFITTPLATKLPTFTPSAPLVIPTYEAFDSQSFAGIPVGFIILVLFGVGIIMVLFTFFRSR